jgi:hypothetical protein
MQCGKGPNAVRTGHTATRVRELGLAEGRGKDPGPGPKAEQRLSRCMALTYAKTANQRLSYCRWCWLLPATPQMPKRRVLAIGINPKTHNTQHTNCNTLPAPHRPVLPPGSSLVSCGKSPAAQRNQDGPTTPPNRRSVAGTALGTQLVVTSMARGLLGSRALTRRSSPNETCQIKRREKVSMCRNTKHIYFSYLFALLMEFSRGGLRICQVPCGQKRPVKIQLQPISSNLGQTAMNRTRTQLRALRHSPWAQADRDVMA